MGGIDPLGVLRNGIPESVDEVIKTIVKNVSKEGGYILSTGAMIAVDTRQKNYDGNDSSCQKILDRKDGLRIHFFTQNYGLSKVTKGYF